MFILHSLHELFSQKHLTIQTQNATLDKCYQMHIYDTCSRLSKSQAVLQQLFDFCNLLFDNFTPARHRIFVNDRLLQLTMAPFKYSLANDRNNKFNTRNFLKFLTCHPVSYESNHMHEFRTELIALVAAARTCGGSFDDWQQYKRILAHLSVQYEFINVNDNRKITIFIDDDKGELHYSIT